MILDEELQIISKVKKVLKDNYQSIGEVPCYLVGLTIWKNTSI